KSWLRFFLEAEPERRSPDAELIAMLQLDPRLHFQEGPVDALEILYEYLLFLDVHGEMPAGQGQILRIKRNIRSFSAQDIIPFLQFETVYFLSFLIEMVKDEPGGRGIKKQELSSSKNNRDRAQFDRSRLGYSQEDSGGAAIITQPVAVRIVQNRCVLIGEQRVIRK